MQRDPEHVASSREVVVDCSLSTVHASYQQFHVTGRSRLTIPSGPLHLATSASPENKRGLSKKMMKAKKGMTLKKVGYLKQNEAKQKEKDDDEKKKVVSGSADPSQRFERAAEIRKPGVRFPVKMRVHFGVKMRSRWFI